MKIKAIHSLLNRLYEIAEAIEIELTKAVLRSNLGSYKNHYIKIGQEWYCQKYYIPVLTVKKKGDIGVNIDGIFFEAGLPVAKISKEKLQKIFKSLKGVEAYGFNHCMRSFWPSKNGISEVLSEMKASGEKTIQFSFNLPLKMLPRNVVKSFLRFSAVLAK